MTEERTICSYRLFGPPLPTTQPNHSLTLSLAHRLMLRGTDIILEGNRRSFMTASQELDQ